MQDKVHVILHWDVDGEYEPPDDDDDESCETFWTEEEYEAWEQEWHPEWSLPSSVPE